MRERDKENVKSHISGNFSPFSRGMFENTSVVTSYGQILVHVRHFRGHKHKKKHIFYLRGSLKREKDGKSMTLVTNKHSLLDFLLILFGSRCISISSPKVCQVTAVEDAAGNCLLSAAAVGFLMTDEILG